MMRFPVGFALSCDIEKSNTRRSGYKPAPVNLRFQTPLFGELRLQGFAAAIEGNFVETLIIIGGAEDRYPAEQISRPRAIKANVERDYGADALRVYCILSEPNTAGNAISIRAALSEMRLAPGDCALLSSHYHLPRAWFELLQRGITNMVPVPAEALLCIADEKRGRA